MSSVGEQAGLQRPYSHGTFQQRLLDFDDLIKEITLQDVEATPEERRQMITENLRFDQFCESIRALFGSEIRNQDLKALYRKISTNPDAKVDWSELFGYFHSDSDDVEIGGGDEATVFMVAARRRVGDAAGDRKRRDTVQCIRYIPSMDSYVTASQKGALSVWTSKLRLQGCADINESAWVTGCDYLPGLRRVATCTERAICIWDNRAKGKTQSVFTIKPMEHSPQCLEWVPHSTLPHEDCLLFGDDQGYVSLLTLSAKDLTMKNSKGDKRYSQNYLIDPNNLTNPIRRRRLHDDWVLKIKYFPDLRCFASCSPSSTSSLVLEEVNRITDDGEVRGVSIPRGVNAFDYCARANIIATGGVDKVIRVWHPHIFSRPTGKLIGHLFTIVDIACNEKDQHLISLSTARVFRIWDIHTLTSLQVFTDNEERPGEKRIYSMIFDNKHERLLTGSSVLDAWPLTRSVQDTMQVPHTHDRPISHVVYNAEVKQVLTVCTESLLRVWEVETGKMVYQILEPHGTNTEVTAVAFDKSGYRLVTAATGGSVKVWDFGSGQEIKWKMGKPGDEEATVMGVQYCTMHGERCIIASGWGNQLQILLDSNDNYELPVIREFSDIHYMSREESLSPTSDPFTTKDPLPAIGTPESIHPVTSVYKKGYVLSENELSCMACLEPDLLVTGCTNGNVVVWDIRKACVNKICSLPEQPDQSLSSLPSSRSSRQKQAENSRSANIALFLTHRVRKLDPAFIKKLTQGDSDDEGDKANEEGAEKTDPEPVPVQEEENVEMVREKAADEDVKATAAPGQGEETPAQAPRVTFNFEGAEESGEAAGAEKAEDDPDSKMIVETFAPVLITGHQDAFLRFWSPQGELLRELSAMTRRQGSAVTALCHDEDANILISGDQRGYLTLWNIGKFLEDPHSENKDLVKQVLCWRAHLTKIVQLAYIDTQQAVISGSTDGSVRIWWGMKGRFIGFYGQHRPLTFPKSESKAGTPVLPYDITEGPMAPVKSVSARTQIKATQQFDYPLVFDNNKWEACPRRSAMVTRSDPNPKFRLEDKFFASLVKPRAYKDHLESFTTGEMRQGAVFRALPVYRVRTPEKPRMPAMSYPRTDGDESPPFMLQGYKKDSKSKNGGKKTSRSLGPNATSNSPTNPPSPKRR